MGLDMYLHARKYVGKMNWNNGNGTPNPTYEAIAALAPEGLLKHSDHAGIYVEYPIAYWRKANAIHGWFIRNCAGDVDVCQEIHINIDTLNTLRDVCIDVIAHPELATTLLPPTGGFFFGNYEVDEWYFRDLNDTVEMINDILKAIGDSGSHEWYIVYQASW